MRKSRVLVRLSTLLLVALAVALVVSPAPVSEHQAQRMDSPLTATETAYYCQRYLQDITSRLNISIPTLEQKKLAAEDDIQDRLAQDGKITPEQAEQNKELFASYAQQEICY